MGTQSEFRYISYGKTRMAGYGYLKVKTLLYLAVSLQQAYTKVTDRRTDTIRQHIARQKEFRHANCANDAFVAGTFRHQVASPQSR